MARTGRQRDWLHWPVARGKVTSANLAVTTDFADANISSDDAVSVTPGSASAAGLQAAAAGAYVTVTDGNVRITHGAAAGTEVWHITVHPVAL